MTVTADEQRRVALPNPTMPGDVFELEAASQARFVLTRVNQPCQSVQLERRDGYLVAITNYPITQAATRQALDDFP